MQQRVAEYKHKNQSLKTKVATLKKQLQDVDQDRELELEREELFLQLTKRVSTLEHNVKYYIKNPIEYFLLFFPSKSIATIWDFVEYFTAATSERK